MTPEQIIALAKEAGMAFYMGHPHPAVMQQLARFAALIEANTREACAKIVEQALYPLPCSNYQDQYNAGVRRTAEQIRRME